MAASTEKQQQIVVGADGSDNAERALQWAMQEAKLRGATLRIVTAWHVPFSVYPSPGPAPPSTTSLEDEMRQAAEAIAAAAASEVREQAELPVETRVVEGHAADVLIDAARDADLLVVGSPAHRGLSPWLTSSASVQCVLHSPVPTAIVH